jgi:N-acetylmuramic acid 6-phosphate (MurNAc-6-P) etherase
MRRRLAYKVVTGLVEGHSRWSAQQVRTALRVVWRDRSRADARDLLRRIETSKVRQAVRALVGLLAEVVAGVTRAIVPVLEAMAGGLEAAAPAFESLSQAMHLARGDQVVGRAIGGGTPNGREGW